MYVRFIRDTTDELIQGDYYYVDTVYGLKEDVYYLLNEKDEMKEYPASDFIRLKTSLVTYVGIPGAEVIEGCKIGEKYRVAEDKGYYFVLENGCSLPLNVVECEEFVPAEPKHMEPMDYDTFLHLLRGMFEFGDMFQLYNRLTDSTEYCSEQSNRHLFGREQISKYMENINRNRVRENAFTDAVLATVTEDFDELECKAGDRFLMLFHDDGTRASVFFEGDGTYITKIKLFDEWPTYKCDPYRTNALAKNEKNKDT